MKRYILVSLLMAVTLVTSGCSLLNRVVGSGKIVSEPRAVSNYDTIALYGIGQVTITQGDTEGLTLTAEDNLIPLIKSEVSGGTLSISLERDANILPTKPLLMDIKVKTLRTLTISGASNVQAAALKGDRLTFNINGAGNIQIAKLDAQELVVSANGAGSMNVAGRVIKQTIAVNGLGNYAGDNLQSDTASVKVAGTGNVNVWVNQTLDIAISGAGSVNYYGAPQVTKRITGVGSVVNLGTK